MIETFRKLSDENPENIENENIENENINNAYNEASNLILRGGEENDPKATQYALKILSIFSGVRSVKENVGHTQVKEWLQSLIKQKKGLSVEEIIDLLSWYVDLWLDVKAKKLNLSEEERKTEKSMFSKGIELIEKALKILSESNILPRRRKESFLESYLEFIPGLTIEVKDPKEGFHFFKLYILPAGGFMEIPVYMIGDPGVEIIILNSGKKLKIDNKEGSLYYEVDDPSFDLFSVFRRNKEILEENKYLIITPDGRVEKMQNQNQNQENVIIVEFRKNENSILIINNTPEDVHVQIKIPPFLVSFISFYD